MGLQAAVSLTAAEKCGQPVRASTADSGAGPSEVLPHAGGKSFYISSYFIPARGVDTVPTSIAFAPHAVQDCMVAPLMENEICTAATTEVPGNSARGEMNWCCIVEACDEF